MSAIWKRLEEREEGFTLIELLVVVIIIGILAAIAIPVFLNQRQSAWERQVESDLRNTAIEVETYYTSEREMPAATDLTDVVQLSTGTEAAGGGESVSDGDASVNYDVDGQHYCITGSHADHTDDDWVAVYDSDQGGIVTGDDPSCSLPQ